MNPVQILIMNKQNDGLGYGYLYNSFAINHANFAPLGWRLWNTDDFLTLRSYLGGYTVAGGKMKETGTIYWNSPNTGADNSSGFTALGGGLRSEVGTFSSLKEFGNFYSSEETIDSNRFFRLRYNSSVIETFVSGGGKRFGASVRLIKDSTTLSDGETSTMTDYDGNTYDTICIGTQEWTVQNWKCTKLNDGTSLTKVTSNTTWAAAGSGDLYYCAYDNNEEYV